MNLQNRILKGLCAILLLALTQSLAAQSKSLKDEVRDKGVAKRSIWMDLPRTQPHTLEQLVKDSDLIVRGQVVSESSRLSEDESTVLTDYAIKIDEIVKDSHWSSVSAIKSS